MSFTFNNERSTLGTMFFDAGTSYARTQVAEDAPTYNRQNATVAASPASVMDSATMLSTMFLDEPTAAMMSASLDDGFAPVIDAGQLLPGTVTHPDDVDWSTPGWGVRHSPLCPSAPKRHNVPTIPRAAPALVDHPIGLLQLTDEELDYLVRVDQVPTVMTAGPGDNAETVAAMDTLVNFESYDDLDAWCAHVSDDDDQ